MTKKIFYFIYATSVSAVILSVFVVTLFFGNALKNQQEKNLLSETENVAAFLNANEDLDSRILFLKQINSYRSNVRSTLILKDGQIAYDSDADASSMENHLERPEVKDAMKYGVGVSERLSDTLAEKKSYVARYLADGSILRLSITDKSIIYYIANVMNPVLLLLFCVIIVSGIAASRLAKKITASVLEINLDEPDEEDVYPELAPLVVRLIKQKKEIEEAIDSIKERSEELAAITRNMNEGVVVLDEKQHIVSVNSSAMSLFGVLEKDCQGHGILSLCRSSQLEETVKKGFEGNFNEKVLELNKKTFMVSVSPIKVNEKNTGVVVLFIDISEKAHSEKMRREFSANVSHELKTPLTSISGYAELIKNGMAEKEDIQNFGERIYSEANRMINLVNDIIKLSMLDEEESRPEEAETFQKEEVNLSEIIKSVIKTLKEAAEKKSVHVDFEESDVFIKGYKPVLFDVFYNLCENGIKYNKEGGNLKISVRDVRESTQAGSNPKNKEVVIVFQDTGIGIPLENQKRVFERFYRVDKSRSKETGGTGLGLAIVKHGVELHGGRVLLSSVPGEGSTFKVIITE